jgi:NTE family protein
LVLQGGGAMGAYHVGVYQALGEAGHEPNWVVGTAFGAINSAIIAGNPVEHRMERLNAFWETIQQASPVVTSSIERLEIPKYESIVGGIPGFFLPNTYAALGLEAHVGVEQASLYTTQPLEATLRAMVDFGLISEGATRLSVNAVNVRTGNHIYFDSNNMAIQPRHIMASIALPPYFSAVTIDGEVYWSGELAAHSPFQYIYEEKLPSGSIIVAVHQGLPRGSLPESLGDVLIQLRILRDSFAARSGANALKREAEFREIITKRAANSSAKNDLAQQDLKIVHVIPQTVRGSDAHDYVAFTAGALRSSRQEGYIDMRRLLEFDEHHLGPQDPGFGSVFG